MSEQLNIFLPQKIFLFFSHEIHLWLSLTHIFDSDVEVTRRRKSNVQKENKTQTQTHISTLAVNTLSIVLRNYSTAFISFDLSAITFNLII